ncbi:MAG: zinc-dependent metalloprotease [Candidatus Eremiobacteraeota bacterium]|nr:zinc-dependent metalloprotease [Candidatus Eremiobacteraeota bacterium]
MRSAILVSLVVLCTLAAAPAKGPTPGAKSDSASSVSYDTLAADGTAQVGLFTIWRYKGDVLLELRPDQFSKDFVELGIPVNGIGAQIFSGQTDYQNVRIVRFIKQDNKVAILFPSTRFLADAGTPIANAVTVASAPTVVGVAKIVSTDAKTGNVVFDASSLLDDVTDLGDVLSDVNGAKDNPLGTYRLDAQSSYFGTTKAFPQNVTIVANQTFTTMQPSADVLSVTPDARKLQMSVQYDIAEIPSGDAYMPRIYDDRVGYFVNAHQDFTSDNSYQDYRNYIVRFNLQPSDPSKPMSPARNPVVYYLSDTIPLQYRDAVREALLKWNAAFARIGISNAVEVRDQPADPSWDPDDIRYNVVRWLTETQGGFAEAQLLYNPYTGEMIKAGIVVDSDLMRFGKFQYPVLVLPQTRAAAQAEARPALLDGGNAFAANERRNFAFGAVALQLMGSGSYPVSPSFARAFLVSIVLHESGHDFGLRHNFIGSQAYTAKNLQNPYFTSRYGLASSVMEYAPLNLWPKGTPQGSYFQTVLGPYDYYVIHWGYAPVPGAHTPLQELPTLHRWADAWNSPQRAFSSDEDADWLSGAAIDPRNQRWDLTDDNIGWCETQMRMSRSLLRQVDRRFPQSEAPYDDLMAAFGAIVGQYEECSYIVSRYLGGEYMSRALRGDRRAGSPLSEIPRGTEKRAFGVLEGNVFGAEAWSIEPSLLREMVTEYRYDDWLSNMPPRHDVSIATEVARVQLSVLARLYGPVTLSRLDDMDLKYRPGTTMDLGDLFTWMQSAVYSEVGKGTPIPLLRRNLQRNYTALLSKLVNDPMAGTPPDAQALARYELRSLRDSVTAALKRPSLDLMTRAHLDAMRADVTRALAGHYVIEIHA